MYVQVQLMQALPLGVWTVQAWNPAATVDRTGVQPPSSVRAGNTHPGRGRGLTAKPLSFLKTSQTGVALTGKWHKGRKPRSLSLWMVLDSPDQLPPTNDRSRGIGWGSQQNAPGIVLPVISHLRHRELIIICCGHRHQLALRMKSCQKMTIAGIPGIGHQQTLTRIQQQCGCQQQRTGATGRNKYSLWLNPHAKLCLVVI